MTTESDLELQNILKGEDKLVAEAKARFQQCVDWESDFRAKFLEDMKFAHADPKNGWQWPGYLWSQRLDDPTGYKPRLTINKIRQHNLQITNEARKNPPSIKISPVGGKATFKAAQAWMGLIRHIERRSRASTAYKTATNFQVDGGLGYIRVLSEYVDDDSFDQELVIKRVRNPMNIYMDPDAQEEDYSDARFAFVFDDVPIDEFYRQYPQWRGRMGNFISALSDSGASYWLSRDHIRIVEYWRRTLKKDKLVLMLNPETKKRIIARWSKVPSRLKKIIKENDSIIQERELFENKVECIKIGGGNIVLEKPSPFPGPYIPIVPVIAEETIIENKLDRKGHTRNMADAQRMYNFWSSSAVEQVALQTKTRWFVPVGATENLETYYNLINRQNYPYIPYNAVDADGNALPAPTPIEPPQMAEGFIKGMMVAKDEFAMTSGQRDENMGVPTNAMTRPAINERQKPGETATYHFIDGLATAIAQVARIILAAAPHIYDTKQIKRILARDGTESMILIDPNADEAYSETKDAQEGEVMAILNPRIGTYWVEPDVGPGYATQRQEAWNAFVQITAQNQELVTQIGDLMFQYADFPGADEIAERLRRLVPPAVLGEGPSPDLQAALQANEQLKKLVTELTDKLAKQELKLTDKQDQKEINLFKAQSDRLKQAGNAVGDIGEETLRPIIEKIIKDMENPQNQPRVGDKRHDEAGDVEEAEEPPIEGARQAADGQWYVPHPQGGFNRVVRG